MNMISRTYIWVKNVKFPFKIYCKVGILRVSNAGPFKKWSPSIFYRKVRRGVTVGCTVCYGTSVIMAIPNCSYCVLLRSQQLWRKDVYINCLLCFTKIIIKQETSADSLINNTSEAVKSGNTKHKLSSAKRNP